MTSVPENNVAAESPRSSRAYAARLMLAASVLGFMGVVVFGASARWPVLGGLLCTRGSGWLAGGVLWASLCVSPIARLAGRSSLNPRGGISAPVLRRALGMTSAWLALVHAVAALAGPLAGKPSAVLDTAHLTSGLLALAVLLVLLLTSFDMVIKRLRLRYWKPLHRLAFVAALLVLQHLALSPSCPRWLVISLASILVVGVGLRALPAVDRRA